MSDSVEIAERYEGLDRIAFWTRWTRFVLAAAIPFILFSIFEAYLVISDGFMSWSPDALDRFDSVSLWIGIGDLVLVLVTFVMFGRWIYVAARNLVDRGVEQFEYTPGWCVGWYFVPIANLFKPFQAMRQIWNGSRGAPEGNIDENHWVLTIWWAGWILAGITGQMAFRMLLGADTYEAFVSGYSWSLASGLISLGVYLTAFHMLTQVNAFQQQWTEYESVFE